MQNEYSYKELYNKWEKFVNGGNDVSHLRKEIAESWKRCRKLNVNPYKIPPLLSDDEFRAVKNKNRFLIELVEPYMELIDDLAKETNFIFILTDNEGNILDVKGNELVMENARKNKLVPGANRSESSGTNAISMALSEDKPMQIVGPEHYNVHFHQWTCSAAPIHDLQGKIIGVICLSGHFSLKHRHTLGMVASLAKAIEKELVFKELVLKEKTKQAETRCAKKKRFTFDDIIGISEGIQSAVKLAKAVAKTDVKVLIEGESGTGKELFAQAIHHASDRSSGPFVAVNCGAIPSDLMESELFGYEEGSFTGAKKGGKPGKFEIANGGTLFLDEVNSMPKEMQVKLLRVLQEGEITRIGGVESIPVNVRVIAASNQPLEILVEKGEFRQDLYFRLGVMVINIPPLRERPEDIPLLFSFLLRKVCNRLGLENVDYDKSLLTYLKSYQWPGNVRELENYIERAVILAQGQKITIEHFPHKILQSRFLPTKGKDLSTLEKVEKEMIQTALEVYDGNITKISKLLGISRNTLYKKIKDYDLPIQKKVVN